MRTVMWASVRVYARRYVATVVAIVVGVGFVVATNVLASATRNGLLADAASEYAGAGSVVTGIGSTAEADRVLSATTASVDARTYQPVAEGRRTLTDEADVASLSSVASLRWQTLTAGSFPTGAGEVVADAVAARQNDVGPGDRITVGAGPDARTFTVTGLVRTSSGPLSGSVYLLWPDLKEYGDSVLVTDVVARTTDTAALADLLPERLTVETRGAHLQAVQKELTQGVDVIAVLLLVFAAIAFFVAGMVIANTFAILLAQRARDFALLRCVGATRRQVRRSVLAEATVVAAGSATLGVLAGVGIGHLLLLAGSAAYPSLPLGSVTLSPTWVVSAWVLGLVVTVVASLLPAWRGTRVSPLAALRPDGAVQLLRGAGRVRLALAGLALLGGGAGLALSVLAHNPLVMVLGGGISFVGVLLLGPVLVPACIRGLGALTGRLGVPWRLAATNALRNPRRTAATTASLLVGVTLVSGLVTGMATVRSAVDGELDKEYPLDLTLTASRPLADDTLARVRAVEGVQRAVALPGADATVRQGRAEASFPVLGVSGADTSVLRSRADVGHPRAGIVYVPWDVLSRSELRVGERARVTVGSRTVVLRIEGATGSGSGGVVAASTLDRLAPDARPRAVWVLASRGADASDVRSAVTSVGWAVDGTVAAGLERRAYVDLQLDVMTAAVLALLAVGVAIALVGIASTLGLSVLERAREHAVLRALGLTRRQLRGTLAVEAAMLATVAAVLGVLLGTFYAWVGVKAVVGAVIGTVQVSLPVGQLALLVLAAGLAGLAACVLPARRAARTAPAAGLSAD